LQIKAWDKILAMRALPEDIFFRLGGNYSTALKNIPDGIYMKVPSTANQAHSITFPLLMPLSTDAEYGTGTDPLSNAEQQALRQFTAYYNDYDKSVKSTNYGIEYIDGAPYGLMEKITPLIATYLKEMYGYWMRYALINGISPNLQASPVSGSVVPHPNTLCVGLPKGNQPAELYSATAATFASTIAAAMAGISAGTSGALNVNMILASADYFTFNKILQPLTIAGSQVYILTVPTSQRSYLMNPSSSGQLGTTWEAVSRYANKDIADLPQVLGQVGNVVLVEDPRAPTAQVYGTGSGTNVNSSTNAIYTDFYLKPGLNDVRSTGVYEACFFLGQGAVADVEPEPAHYEQEYQYLKKTIIKGAMGSRGFNRMDYDKSTATDTSKINQSSGVIWCRKQTNSFG
jgi:hypothetical protein